MNKTKKIIAILIAVLIIIIVALIVFLKKSHDQMGSDTGSDLSQEVDTYVPTIVLKEVDNQNKYYAVKNIINKYYLNLVKLSQKADSIEIQSEVRVKSADFSVDEYLDEKKKESKDEILACLDKEFIDDSNINENNITEKLGEFNEGTIYIDKMYVVEESSSISTYFVYSYIRNSSTNEIKEFNVMIRADSKNYTYTILPYDYMVKKGYDKIELGQEFKTDIGMIEDKKYNKFSYMNMTDNDYAIDLLESYKNNLLYNTEKAYETLDDDYKNKRFGDIEEFKKYIRNNKNDLLFLTLSKYSKNKLDDNCIIYTCIDTRGNKYIFKQSAILDYKLILDSYTLESDEFNSKYDKEINKNKCIMNAQKFIESINLKDYKYSYGVLDSNFKDRYFKSQDDFEIYIKQILFDKNVISTTDYTEYEDVGTLKLKIKNGLSENDEKDFNIIMKLNDDRKYTMSFQVQ